MRYASLLLRLSALAVRRPALVPLLFAAAWRFRACDWYRTAPFVPLPPRDYLAWRLQTAFGGEDTLPGADALERYLRWNSAMNGRADRLSAELSAEWED